MNTLLKISPPDYSFHGFEPFPPAYLLLILDRRKCVFFTNDMTRYSFLVTGLKKTDLNILDEIFRQGLFKVMLSVCESPAKYIKATCVDDMLSVTE